MGRSLGPSGQDTREKRDQRLFADIVPFYCRKDLLPASRLARRHRLLQTCQAVPNRAAPAILEVGCGAGFSALYLAEFYGTYVGIDYAEPCIAYARQHNQQPKATFEVSNIKTYQNPQRFDMILMIGVLHHIENIEEAMSTIMALLKPGGWFVANEPHPGNPLIRLARFLRKKLDSSYSAEQQELSATALQRLYQEAGLQEIQTIPQGLLSTPFAEVILQPQGVMQGCAALACAIDTVLERFLGRLLRPFSWNLIAIGRKPDA